MKYVSETTLADLRADQSEIKVFYRDAVQGQVEFCALRAGLNLDKSNGKEIPGRN